MGKNKRYFELDDEVELSPEQGGNDMSELSTLRDQISALQLANEKNRHEAADRLRDRDDQFSGLQGSLQKMVDMLGRVNSDQVAADRALDGELSGLRAELATRPTEEQVKALMIECMSDPSGSACQILAGMARESAEELQPEGLHLTGEDGREFVLDHSSWDEVLKCTDGCRDGLCEVLPDHPDMLSDALKKVGEKDKEKLAKIVSESGFETPAKKKNPHLGDLWNEE